MSSLYTFTCEGLGPLSVSVGLPPVLILPVDDVQDVSALERDAQLVARDVEIVVGVVVEVRAEVELGEGGGLEERINNKTESRNFQSNPTYNFVARSSTNDHRSSRLCADDHFLRLPRGGVQYPPVGHRATTSSPGWRRNGRRSRCRCGSAV